MIKSKSTNEFKKLLKLLWKQKKFEILYIILIFIIMIMTLITIKSTNEELDASDKQLTLPNTKIEQIKKEQVNDKYYKTSQDVSDIYIIINSIKPVQYYYMAEIPLDKEFQKYTYNLCQDKQIDYDLVLAVMWIESRFDINAVNHNRNGTNDSGIMQMNDIMKDWALKNCNITDFNNPKDNILVGVSWLSYLTQTYGENDGIIAYKSGVGGMKSIKNKGIKITDYAQNVLNKRDEFKLMNKTN